MSITQKPADEPWRDYVERMGREARFEGIRLEDNPYPKPGFLCHIWDYGWKKTDRELSSQTDSSRQ